MLIKDIFHSIKNYSYYRVTGFPNTANYDLTGKCNSNCIMCYFKNNYIYNEKNELSTLHWSNVFKAHHIIGIKNAFLTGGEPLLRPDVINEADKIFENVWITSNGIIKVPYNIDRRIFISLDGTKEKHNIIRNVESFDTIVKNITNDRRVVIATTLSTVNYHEIENMVEIARDTNVHGITFSMCTGTLDDDSLVLKDYKLDAAVSELKRVLKINKDIVLLTNKMIDNFKNKKHINRCLLRKKWVVSLYPDLSIKSPCVLGDKVNCNTCGCIVPVMMDTVVYQHDFSGLNVLKRMYPSHASSIEDIVS